jgi:hypothetical protein
MSMVSVKRTLKVEIVTAIIGPPQPGIEVVPPSGVFVEPTYY